MRMSGIAPYQVMEINVISAQDLAQVSKSVRAYAVAWLHQDRKLATQIDQEGHTNPTWNEKFVFRVDDQFLNAESSVIMIEIYTSAWLRDVLIGTVGVLVKNLLPPSPNRKPKLRFVALQIRRPSGRPQGILNIGVTLLDSTMRSMPLYSELSSSAVGYWDIMESKNKKMKNANTQDNDNIHHRHKNNENLNSPSPLDSSLLTLQRCQSEKNDSTINDYTYHGNGKPGNSYYGYDDGQDSEMGVRKGGFFNEGSLCSDVGPSPSVVAAAIAKGLHPMPPPRTAESSTVDGWSEDHCTATEGMKAKIERWRTELTPGYEDYDDERRKQTSTRVGKPPRRGGPCSCFGKMFGCEITITCGGGNRGKRRGGGKGRLTNTASQLTFDDSYI